MSTILHSVTLAIAGSLTDWVGRCKAVGTRNLETSLADHPRVYAEAVTCGTESLGAVGTPHSGSLGLTHPNPALEQPTAVEQTGESKQGGASPVPLGAPTEAWRGRFWLGMGWQVPGLGLSRDLNAGGLVCAEKGGEAVSCLFYSSSRCFWRVSQVILLSLVLPLFLLPVPPFVISRGSGVWFYCLLWHSFSIWRRRTTSIKSYTSIYLYVSHRWRNNSALNETQCNSWLNCHISYVWHVITLNTKKLKKNSFKKKAKCK